MEYGACMTRQVSPRRLGRFYSHLMQCSRFLTVALVSVILPVQSVTAATEMYFVHSDHLGTPVKLTDSSQGVVWAADKKPFGETNTTESVAEDSRFPGQYFDAESGTSYNYYRDYDPSLGRYIQSDPIGLGGGLNTYAYVGGNPFSYVDPTGEFGQCAIWPVGTAACAASGGAALYRVYRGARAAAAIADAINQANEEASGEGEQCPAPAVPGNPWSPSEVDKRRSETRRQEGAPSVDPDSPIPDRGPGSDQGGHDSRNRTPHDTGERNVNRHEEHSRVPKTPSRY